MIKTHACYTVACDVCDEAPEGIEYTQEHFDTAEQAIGDASEAGWWATSTDVLCDDRDEEHLAKAKEIRAAFGDGDAREFEQWVPEEWRDQLRPAEPRFAAAMPGQTVIPTHA